jgi:hypothetical protein
LKNKGWIDIICNLIEKMPLRHEDTKKKFFMKKLGALVAKISRSSEWSLRRTFYV